MIRQNVVVIEIGAVTYFLLIFLKKSYLLAPSWQNVSIKHLIIIILNMGFLLYFNYGYVLFFYRLEDKNS